MAECTRTEVHNPHALIIPGDEATSMRCPGITQTQWLANRLGMADAGDPNRGFAASMVPVSGEAPPDARVRQQELLDSTVEDLLLASAFRKLLADGGALVSLSTNGPANIGHLVLDAFSMEPLTDAEWETVERVHLAAVNDDPPRVTSEWLEDGDTLRTTVVCTDHDADESSVTMDLSNLHQSIGWPGSPSRLRVLGDWHEWWQANAELFVANVRAKGCDHVTVEQVLDAYRAAGEP